MKAILILQLLAGLALLFVVPAFERASVVALWSDFQAFQARAAADEAGVRILGYGGENPQEPFEHLLERMWNLQWSRLSRAIGLLISLLSAFGLFLHSRAKRTDGHAIQTQA